MTDNDHRTRHRYLRRRHRRRARPAAVACSGPPPRAGSGGAGRSGRHPLHRRRRAPSTGLLHFRARSDAGRDCRPDVPHPPGVVGHGAQHRRSRARLRAILDAERAVERTRRGDRRPRLVHGVVSAVRLRPRPVRAALRRAAAYLRGAALGQAGHVVGTHALSAPGSDRVPAHRERADACLRGSVSAGLRSRWFARRTTGLPLMLAIIGGNPRRFAAYAICITDRSRSSATARCRSACIRRVTSRRPTNRRVKSSGRTMPG